MAPGTVTSAKAGDGSADDCGLTTMAVGGDAGWAGLASAALEVPRCGACLHPYAPEHQCACAPVQGTSMATPVTAGSAVLLRQYFTDGYFPSGRWQPGSAHSSGSWAGMAQIAAQARHPVPSTLCTCHTAELTQQRCPRLSLAAGSRNPADTLTPTGALLKAVMMGGSTTIVGFEADTGLPVDPPPSFRQGFGRVHLGGWWLACLLDGLCTHSSCSGCQATRLTRRHPAAPEGNSVYLANTPGSKPFQLLDAVPISTGGCRVMGGRGGEKVLTTSWQHAILRPMPLMSPLQMILTHTASAPTAVHSPSPWCGTTSQPASAVRLGGAACCHCWRCCVSSQGGRQQWQRTVLGSAPQHLTPA